MLKQRGDKRELGGTLLGIILGLLLGLAGALAVAVYVTKVPVPFVDRAISRKPSEDAAEAERNRNWNPNNGLGGKQLPGGQTPPSATDDTAKAEKIEKTDKTADASTAKEAKEAKAEPAKVEAQPEPKGKVYSTDPLGDLANAKGQGKTVSTGKREAEAPPPAVEPFTYFVQVGAFRTPEDAQAQRAKLALMGLDARISEREQNGRTVYRVRLGPYERQVDAEKMKEDLLPSGLETALVRVQR